MTGLEGERKGPSGGSIGSALLRHVSPDGCQLLLDSGAIRVGMRLAVLLDPAPDPVIRVAGTVRWIVSDRVGFEFEEKLGEALHGALRPLHFATTPVEVHRA